MNSFTLANFKKVIPRNLITEGERIYKLGDVKKIVSADGRDWNVDVSVGREIFNVEISVDLDKNITDHFCDCPSETEHCHHQAAAFLKLKEILPTFKAGTTNKPQKKELVVKKKKKAVSPVEAILDEVSMLELHAFIIKSASEDKSFKSLFMLYFADKNESNDKKYYGDILKNTLSNIKRNGHLNKTETKKYVKTVEGLASTASDAIASLKFKDFAPIALALIETMEPHFKRLDDGEYKLHKIQEQNFQNFVLAAQRAPYEIRVTIIKDLLAVIEPILTDLYDHYQHGGFITMLKKIGQVAELKDIFISFVEKNLVKKYANDSFWAFISGGSESSLEIELVELARTFYLDNKSEDKIPKLLAKHTHISKYRKEYIDYLCSTNNYQEARKILENLLFTTNFSGRITGIDFFYFNKIEEIYEKLNDTQGIINTLQLRFRLGDFKQLSILEKIKKIADKTQWEAVFEQTKKDILAYDKARHSNIYGFYNYSSQNKIPLGVGHLYVFDARWDELNAMVKKNNDLESYGAFCEYLLIHNYKEAFGFFKQKLESFLTTVDYSKYPIFAQILKNLQGFNDETQEFIRNLLSHIRKHHSGKKKLAEELRKVGILV
jgi:hypothetical protein